MLNLCHSHQWPGDGTSHPRFVAAACRGRIEYLAQVIDYLDLRGIAWDLSGKEDGGLV